MVALDINSKSVLKPKVLCKEDVKDEDAALPNLLRESRRSNNKII